MQPLQNDLAHGKHDNTARKLIALTGGYAFMIISGISSINGTPSIWILIISQIQLVLGCY
jgi:hypothetical protein